ncbi:TetR/AcrR family transcriptional regulator [Ciceribacter sp. L1K22]|uniref:TetR/AcrR family transcriptional regulator n=1 Tax=Ciceribacter sp. L1K22 TaxID=2820275 RepID=UPI001ABE6BE7|nr:TetR/AcrR family transcriptional regulator [Ciceribacter sp. L1K22]MBO3760748.1 TetR/AcrR family transcriptional regulator [Ciceribacter sp. L1K22]
MPGQEKNFERVNQKKRTRAELMRAALELTERGLSPTVVEAAEHAGISKATAYRYFSTAEDMIREAVLDAVANRIQVQPLSDDSNASCRAVDVIGQVLHMVETNEATFRALLASTVGGSHSVKRAGRRADWLSEALQPLEAELSAADFRRLVHALGLMCGIETLVVLKDVCDLETEEAIDTALWAARKLIAGVLADVSTRRDA